MFRYNNLIYIYICTVFISAQIKIPDNIDIRKLKKAGISVNDIKKIAKKTNVDGINESDAFQRSNESLSTDTKEIIQKDLKSQFELDRSINVSSLDSVNKNNIKLIDDDALKKITIKKSDEIRSVISDDKKKEQYFGYNVFSVDPDFFQGSIDETIDPNYLISPGDEIIIMLWGETESNDTYTVTKNGYIFVNNIGQVFVNGLTLLKLEKKLFKILKKVYSTLGPTQGDATTFFDVSLGSSVLRPLRIFAVGEVSFPGAYTVKQSTTLFSSLYYFKGPTFKGSLRDIKLMRSGKEVKSIDFYNYLLKGKQLNDIQLQRDDLIFIPLRGKTVNVKGEINRPFLYELNDDESLLDLVEIAGGYKETTYMERIQIDRIIPYNERSGKNIDRTIVDVNLRDVIKSGENVKILDGDIITFFKISNEKGNIARISGSVQRPGEYDLGVGLNLKDLINKAGGLIGDTYFDRAEIIRFNDDLSQTYISVNLKGAMDEKPEDNISLRSKDIVTIYDNSSMIYKTSIMIDGYVLNPGIKTFKKDMTLGDLIFQGGGFENSNRLSNTYLERAELYRWDEGYRKRTLISFNLDSVLSGKGLSSLPLKMGDQVKIYNKDEILGSEPQTITIAGYVKNPGSYPYLENMNMNDLMFMSGGIKDVKYYERLFMDRFDLVRFDLEKNKFTLQSMNLYDALDNNNIDLRPNDKIIIYSKDMFDMAGGVEIQGIVKKPGAFELKENMTLLDLILESGGVADSIYYFRAEIASIDPLNLNQDIYSNIRVIDLVNNENIYKKNEKLKNNPKNINLKPYDRVIIRPSPYFNKQKTVFIGGGVSYPGEYFLSGPNDLASDIIARAGGLTTEGYPEASRFIRNNEEIRVSFQSLIKNPRSKANFKLIPGDRLIIGKKPNLIKIEGEVNRPGNFQYIKGNKFDDYIKIAGGYTEDAVRSQAYVLYPDGRSKQNSVFANPKIIDGSILFIPAEQEVEPFNVTEYVTNWTTIWADVTQAYLMVVIALRQ